MNETLQNIQKRYSCRGYTDVPVPDDLLHAIAYSGLCAPSTMGSEPWHIVIVKDEALIAEMQEYALGYLQENIPSAYDRCMSRGGKLFYDVRRMIFVAQRPDADGQTPELDSGIVTQNMVLAATSLGVANVICGIARFCFTGDRKEVYEKRLGFPEGYVFGMSLLLGYEKEAGAPHQPDESKITVIE